ncbi:hypothetical protein BGZ57DRAFT_185552 [Hyaloscypha finlandica]|nr:hypothetical protein BGZ57DRAFT_185552 [Hyaloscypha finlandica]KAH8796063.1 hypothetical protein F5882DRAFT_375266 [Hyaloscypha sp. PMI_1271]
MAALAPLSMSQRKDDLLKHLNMDAETYSLMAKETDVVYKWLTSENYHLKENCKRRPPYDWSDIKENSKDEAMSRIAQSGNPHTQWYWDLAVKTPDCPNWIARWFLYHKFRYRDGRNRNPAKNSGSGKHHHSHRHGSSSRHHQKHRSEEHEQYYDEQEEYYPEESMASAPAPQEYYAGGYSGGYAAATPAVSSGYTAGYPAGYTDPVAPTYAPYDPSPANGEDEKVYYDPVRDMTR